MSTEAVYHHLTPQTYMRAWKHGKSSSIYVVDKGANGLGSSKKTKKFAGIDNYHTIRAGSPISTEDDCKKFFHPLNGYIVKIDGKVVNNVLDMNNQFYEFDKWTIIDNKGSIVSKSGKDALKKAILSIHVKDIEVDWARKYENDWNSINAAISNEVFVHPNSQSIAAIKRDELIKFMVSLEWRTIPYHPELLKIIDVLFGEKIWGVDFKLINIPEDERLFPFLETMYDEYAHSYILNNHRKFLAGNGPIMDEALDIINNLVVVLLLAPSNGEFITSDNPVCRFTNKQGDLEYIFPINPKIACKVTRGGTQTHYPLKRLTKSELIIFNNELKDNCYKGYILRDQNLSLYF
ncbi:DUF4238 domain-containing protein [Metabacillus fastidiosus]|uniref:DUF4238 domain-containing protein n=1 Tax=Metabacillus fastidiosus TaxID=1458 RepID=UPI0008262729|nr:DUF4238 domain-containing protein [Metabacillus fastidiosus]